MGAKLPAIIEFPLVGPGGEPVDFRRTINGHGVTTLPPLFVDDRAASLRATISVNGLQPRTITITAPRADTGRIEVHGPPLHPGESDQILATARHILRLDEDLSPFYLMAQSDPALSWVASGAGRMTRCQTVYEDVIKTICTTNCTWSATIRMVNALVQHVGEPAVGAQPDTWHERAFPAAERLANADDEFFRGIVRCGYRGAYLKKLSQSVVDGDVELESLGQATEIDRTDDEVAATLLALPGVGPYAAAHIMMMLGRYSRLIFDSWTRPAYAKLTGRESVTDQEIRERFAPYGRFAGLAFWLAITQDWITAEE